MLNSIICAAYPLSGLDNETHELESRHCGTCIYFPGAALKGQKGAGSEALRTVDQTQLGGLVPRWGTEEVAGCTKADGKTGP